MESRQTNERSKQQRKENNLKTFYTHLTHKGVVNCFDFDLFEGSESVLCSFPCLLSSAQNVTESRRSFLGSLWATSSSSLAPCPSPLYLPCLALPSPNTKERETSCLVCVWYPFPETACPSCLPNTHTQVPPSFTSRCIPTHHPSQPTRPRASTCQPGTHTSQ